MVDWTPNQLNESISQGDAIFLKLWKKGCGPCKLSNPAVEKLESSGNYQDITFAKICIDDHPQMLEISETDVLPAFFFFKDKKMQGKQIGFKGIKKLEELLGATS